MKISQLFETDKNLKIEREASLVEVSQICAFDDLKPNGVVFVKNIKFYRKIIPSFPKIIELKIGLIFDRVFYESLSPEQHQDLSQVVWIATTPSIPESLTLLSKPFYDRKMSGLNFHVDGRQMGTADISPYAQIAQNVFIGEHVQIENGVVIMPGSVILPHSKIGEGTVIYPNVTIYPFVEIGKDVRIHSGTTIGSDGFGYTFMMGIHQKIWHMGGVKISDHVEIGSNVSIDGGTFSPTLIGAGTKIDNFVQVAHNCKIGKGCVLCGHSGLAGSAVIEDYVVLGGKAGVGPDAYLEKGVQVAGAGMVNDGAHWPAGSKIGGHPARELKTWMRSVAYLNKVSAKEK